MAARFPPRGNAARIFRVLYLGQEVCLILSSKFHIVMMTTRSEIEMTALAAI